MEGWSHVFTSDLSWNHTKWQQKEIKASIEKGKENG